MLATLTLGFGGYFNIPFISFAQANYIANWWLVRIELLETI